MHAMLQHGVRIGRCDDAQGDPESWAARSAFQSHHSLWIGVVVVVPEPPHQAQMYNTARTVWHTGRRGPGGRPRAARRAGPWRRGAPPPPRARAETPRSPAPAIGRARARDGLIDVDVDWLNRRGLKSSSIGLNRLNRLNRHNRLKSSA